MFFIRELGISGTLDLVNAALFSSAPVSSQICSLKVDLGSTQAFLNSMQTVTTL